MSCEMVRVLAPFLTAKEVGELIHMQKSKTMITEGE